MSSTIVLLLGGIVGIVQVRIKPQSARFAVEQLELRRDWTVRNSPERGTVMKKISGLIGLAVLLGLVLLKPGAPSDAQTETGPPSDMVLIPAGEFVMGFDGGRPDEGPSRKVFVEAFYIDRYEVTNAQFKQYADTHGIPFSFPPGMGSHPVVNITWDQANGYARWVGKRLPTETEWEKAARGTDEREYPWGNEWDASRCNSQEATQYPKTAPVGSFPSGASPYGVQDMVGNVWEWVQEWYDADLHREGVSYRPRDPRYGMYRTIRGGSWLEDRNYQRCSTRGYLLPRSMASNVGFRCAKTR